MSKKELKIDSLKQVSGGVKPTHIYCTKCGHDYGSSYVVLKLNEKGEHLCPVCNEFVKVEWK